MLIIMSPTKTFREIEESKLFNIDNLNFTNEIEELLECLKAYTIEDLSRLMKMSDSLGEINYKRYKYFHEDTFKAYPAVLYYYGEAFKSLEADNLSGESLDFAQNHLRILSGLYGVLKPFDIIKEYRLEMGSKLVTRDKKDLYKYWREKLTDCIVKELESISGDQVLLNVASDEYSKAINMKEVRKNFAVVTVSFKENREGTYKVVGTYAKKARGKFIKYILENKIESLRQVKQFNEDGYSFSVELSSEDAIVFVREAGMNNKTSE